MRGPPVNKQTQHPPLILIHQNPSPSVEYDFLLREMAKNRPAIAFDTPGRGMSDWPLEPQDMTGNALAFADVLDSLKLSVRQPVDVFGYHMSTFLSAELALAHPRRIGRVVLSRNPFRTIDERKERLEENAAGPRLTESGDEILAMLHALWTFVVADRDPGVPLERAARIFIEKAKPMDRYWWPYKGVSTYEVADRFPLLKQPVLVLQSNEDLLQNSKDASAYIDDLRIVELPDLKRDDVDVGLVTVWFRSLVSHYATLASKAKGLMPPRYEWRLRVL